jgi:hypothetical protein
MNGIVDIPACFRAISKGDPRMMTTLVVGIGFLAVLVGLLLLAAIHLWR